MQVLDAPSKSSNQIEPGYESIDDELVLDDNDMETRSQSNNNVNFTSMANNSDTVSMHSHRVDKLKGSFFDF